MEPLFSVDVIYNSLPDCSVVILNYSIHSVLFVYASVPNNEGNHNVPVKSKLKHPPPGIPRAFDVFPCPGGREFDELSLSGAASLDFMLRVALIPRGVINHDGDKP